MADLNNLNRNDWRAIFELITELGEIEEVSEFCRTALELIKELIPYQRGHFIFYDQPERQLVESLRCETDDLFLNYQQDIDDFFQAYFNLPYPRQQAMVLDYKEWQRLGSIDDFFLPNDFYYILINDIDYKEELITTISLIRDRTSSDFTTKELTYLAALKPYLASQLYKLVVIESFNRITPDRIARLMANNEKRFKLSPREREVINLLSRGLNNNQIADQLFISAETIKKHLHNIFNKTDVSNRTQLLARIIGLI